MAKVRQRYQRSEYINTTPGEASPNYALMGTGYKAIGDAPAAQTGSKRYVHEKASSNSIKSYSWSSAFELDQIPDEAAVEFIFNIGFKELVGADAETDLVQVYLDQPISQSTGEYKARKRKIAVEVADNPDNDGELGTTGNLLGIGDPIFGKFNITTKTFSAEEE